jgi:hypothetical protein
VSVIDGFEEAREELEALLIEVLGTVFGEEAGIAWGQSIPPGPVVSSRLAIHDEEEDSYTVVEIRTGGAMAQILASRMMTTADPSPDDLLDAVAELGNIAGGNVKSLLRHACRLSLPTAEVTQDSIEPEPPVDGVAVQACVLGQVVELIVYQADAISGLCWPGSPRSHVLENQS